MTRTSAVIVWDHRHDPPHDAEEVLCWRSYAHGESFSSVPRYLEDHAERLREKYLAFIHDLGEWQIGGKRVVDHLDMGDGFSLWWMTQIAEKSPLKSPRIYDCLRLIALEEILVEKNPRDLTLVSSDRALGQAMRRLCKDLNIGFRWEAGNTSRQRWSLRRFYDALPFPVKGLISLRYIVMRWPLRKLKRPQWFSGENATFICSYFIHLDPAICRQGSFHSRQWEGLPRSLHEGGRRTNWIQLFMQSTVVPDVGTGLGWLRQFNRDARNQGCHAFLESYLTLSHVFRALKFWLWLNVVSWNLRDIQSAFHLNGTAVWLWPLLRSDWCTSLTGPIAIGNCLSLTLFDDALADMPRQVSGLYLYENQAWEKAFLRAWRKHGHGEIIGVQHATVPFWHLYYFDDRRTLNSGQESAMPLPDRLAVNGLVAWRAFANTGYPPEKLVEVEALRYLSLLPLIAKSTLDFKGGSAIASPGSSVRGINVLILGDMIPAAMHEFLGVLEEAMPRLAAGFKFTFKPHPGYAVNLANYPGLLADETTEALHRILEEYDIALSANSTSASIDAYLAGLDVIVGLDGNELNLSPLRGQPGACFVSTPEELITALQAASCATAAATVYDRNEFFFLDPGLPRWKRLLPPVSPS